MLYDYGQGCELNGHKSPTSYELDRDFSYMDAWGNLAKFYGNCLYTSYELHVRGSTDIVCVSLCVLVATLSQA